MPSGRKTRRRSAADFWREHVGGVPRWVAVFVGIPLALVTVAVVALAYQRLNAEPTAAGGSPAPPAVTEPGSTEPGSTEPTPTASPTPEPEPEPEPIPVVTIVGDGLTATGRKADDWSVRATKAVDAKRKTSVVAGAGFVVGEVPFADPQRLREVVRTHPAAVVVETSGVDAFTPPDEVGAAVRTVVKRLKKEDALVVIVGPVASATVTPELVALDDILDASADEFGARHVSVLDWIDDEGMLDEDGAGLTEDGDRRLAKQVARALRGI